MTFSCAFFFLFFSTSRLLFSGNYYRFIQSSGDLVKNRDQLYYPGPIRTLKESRDWSIICQAIYKSILMNRGCQENKNTDRFIRAGRGPKFLTPELCWEFTLREPGKKERWGPSRLGGGSTLDELIQRRQRASPNLKLISLTIERSGSLTRSYGPFRFLFSLLASLFFLYAQCINHDFTNEWEREKKGIFRFRDCWSLPNPPRSFFNTPWSSTCCVIIRSLIFIPTIQRSSLRLYRCLLSLLHFSKPFSEPIFKKTTVFTPNSSGKQVHRKMFRIKRRRRKKWDKIWSVCVDSVAGSRKERRQAGSKGNKKLMVIEHSK